MFLKFCLSKNVNRNILYLSFSVLFAVPVQQLHAQKKAMPAYDFSRAPLLKNANVPLPLGSIKAKGWLLKQLELQAAGFTGHAEELYPESGNLGPQSDWLGGDGGGWERVPYYLKGLVALGYTLNDPALIAKSQKWIDWTLDNQQENGVFGPAKMDDWWPRMPMLYTLQSYFEATQDKRVLPFMTKYFKYELANLPSKPLYEWSKSRAGDNIDVVLWLYNKTGDKFLLELTDLLQKQAYPWKSIFTNNEFYFFGDDFHTKHSVSVGEALRFPALGYLRNGDGAYKTAFKKGIANLIESHGQPSGIASGTEFLAGRSGIQGVETCTVVEWMQSLETAARIIEDASIGDRLEKIAFNQLPAQFSKDLKEHFYYTQPNQVRSKFGLNGFDEDYPEGLLLSPYSGMGCCRYNMHMGWPYFVKNSWAASPDGGLTVIAYSPTEVNALVAGNVPIKIEEETNYPFDEQIKLKISLSESTEFPLRLRIPAWCKNPTIKINGKDYKGVKAGEIVKINRHWKNKDEVLINFPMEVNVAQQVNNSVSVERGPLVYALQIDNKYEIVKSHPVKGFYDYQITPTQAWNYGLLLDNSDLAKQITVKKYKMPENPFDPATTPIRLSVKAQEVTDWKMAYNGILAFEVPYSPVSSAEPVVQVTLIPSGAEKIRISCFPVIGAQQEKLKSFTANFNDGKMDDWVFYGGGWFVKDGAISAASNHGSWGAGIHGSKVIAAKVNADDFVLETDINPGKVGNSGVVFRVNNPSIGADLYEGYYVGINPVLNRIEIGKSINKTYVLLASSPLKVQENKKYRLSVTAKGDAISVFLDGSAKSIVSVKDDEFKSGSVGLRSYDAFPTYDNISVKAM